MLRGRLAMCTLFLPLPPSKPLRLRLRHRCRYPLSAGDLAGLFTQACRSLFPTTLLGMLFPLQASPPLTLLQGRPRGMLPPSRTCPHVPLLARLLLRKLKPHPRSTRTSMLLPTASPCPRVLLTPMGNSCNLVLSPRQQDLPRHQIPCLRGPLLHHHLHRILSQLAVNRMRGVVDRSSL